MVSISAANMWPANMLQACEVAGTDIPMMQDTGDPMLLTLSGRTCLKVLSRTQSLALTSRQPLVSSSFCSFAGISVDQLYLAYLHDCIPGYSSVKNRLHLHFSKFEQNLHPMCMLLHHK